MSARQKIPPAAFLFLILTAGYVTPDYDNREEEQIQKIKAPPESLKVEWRYKRLYERK